MWNLNKYPFKKMFFLNLNRVYWDCWRIQKKSEIDWKSRQKENALKVLFGFDCLVALSIRMLWKKFSLSVLDPFEKNISVKNWFRYANFITDCLHKNVLLFSSILYAWIKTFLLKKFKNKFVFFCWALVEYSCALFDFNGA